MADSVENLRFDGRFTSGDGLSSRYSVELSYRRTSPMELSVEIFWHGDDAERHRGMSAASSSKTNRLFFKNDNAFEGHLELLGVVSMGAEFKWATAVVTRPEVRALQVGIHRDIETEERLLNVTVRLWPSGLLDAGTFVNDASGEIRHTREPGPPLLIRTRFGELKLGASHAYERGEEHGNRVNKQVRQSQLWGEIMVAKGSSLNDVHEELVRELERVCLALSLATRQAVRFFEISYLEFRPDPEPNRTAFMRVRLPLFEERSNSDDLIAGRNLTEGGLQLLVDRIAAHSNPADLERSVTFLAGSYKDSLENAFFMAFSAMETAVNLAAGEFETVQLSNSKWGKLESAVRETVRSVSAGWNVDPIAITEKVPELRRPSFRRRLAMAIRHHPVETSDLWVGRVFNDEMVAAAEIRNGLFHSAKYTNGRAIARSLVRIQAFTERLILKMLDWPEDRRWVWRDQHLKFANRGDAPTNLIQGASGEPQSESQESKPS